MIHVFFVNILYNTWSQIGKIRDRLDIISLKMLSKYEIKRKMNLERGQQYETKVISQLNFFVIFHVLQQ